MNNTLPMNLRPKAAATCLPLPLGEGMRLREETARLRDTICGNRSWPGGFSRPIAKRFYPMLGGLLLALIVTAWPTADARGGEPVAPRLTPKLQKLFAEEMVAILQASQQIVAALVAGDHAAVAKNAQAVHDSFILDRNLTTQDRQAIETTVPPAFLELDGAFHQMAAKLAEAARRQDVDLENYYFGRMLAICGTCHRQHATDKFPALGGKSPAASAH